MDDIGPLDTLFYRIRVYIDSFPAYVDRINGVTVSRGEAARHIRMAREGKLEMVHLELAEKGLPSQAHRAYFADIGIS